MKANPTLIKSVRILTIASAALAALAGGLGTLPIDSASLPMPPEWRPYLMGVAFLSLSIRAVVVPTLDSIIAKIRQS